MRVGTDTCMNPFLFFYFLYRAKLVSSEFFHWTRWILDIIYYYGQEKLYEVQPEEHNFSPN